MTSAGRLYIYSRPVLLCVSAKEHPFFSEVHMKLSMPVIGNNYQPFAPFFSNILISYPIIDKPYPLRDIRDR